MKTIMRFFSIFIVIALLLSSSACFDAGSNSGSNPQHPASSIEPINTEADTTNPAVDECYGFSDGCLTIMNDDGFSFWEETIDAKTVSEIVIADGITRIPAFFGGKMENVKKVTLPDGIEVIESEAFEGMKSLSAVTLPKTVREIGCYAFNVNTSLSVADGSQYFKMIDGMLIDLVKESVVFSNPDIIEAMIPEGIKRIEVGAFMGRKGLVCVKMPDSMLSIGYAAFSFCTNLSTVDLNNVDIIEGNAFSSCSSLHSIKIPAGCSIICGDYEESTPVFDSLERIIFYSPYGDVVGETALLYYCRNLEYVCFSGGIPEWFSIERDVLPTGTIIAVLTEHAVDWAPNGETDLNGHALFICDTFEDLCGN